MAALNFPQNPLDGDIYGDYTFDGTKGVWVVIPMTKPTLIDSFLDVEVSSSVSANDALLYDSISGLWKSSAIPASAITSGTFDVARIPTGTTSSTVSLGNHTHTAGDIPNLESLNGTLDIANGGTGATTASAAQDNLGIGLVNVVPTSVAQAGGSASANAQGLVSYTGVTSVSLNYVFTSAYDSYRIVLRNTASTANGDINFRLRNGGSDITTNSYSRQIFIVRLNGTTASAGNAGINYFPLGAIAAGSNVGYYSIDLHGASKTAEKSINQIGYSNDTTSSYTGISSCFIGVATATDGFTLSASAGNITGTVQVFGYNN